MSAVRQLATRWIDTDRPPLSEGARAAIALALLCPAIFLCFFLVGRSTLSASTPHPTAAPSLPLTYTGIAIPARLGSAPTIGAIAPVRTRRVASAGSTPSTSVTQPQVASSSPAPVSTPAPAVPRTPAPAHRSQPRRSERVSFDSSG
ncbi:MAG TPA: hypothetical protein VFY36_00770 [Solirubrobacteraceae bacterium]|nr:hypothetical protein [Solirubrobacteraceae bacterium]